MDIDNKQLKSKRGGKREGSGRKKKNIRRVSIRLDGETYREISKLSQQQELTISEYIRFLIKKIKTGFGDSGLPENNKIIICKTKSYEKKSETLIFCDWYIGKIENGKLKVGNEGGYFSLDVSKWNELIEKWEYVE